MTDVLDKYEASPACFPRASSCTKRAPINRKRRSGFRSAAEARVPACDLVWMRSTAFRLIRKGMQEPWRGTLCSVGDESYLFTRDMFPGGTSIPVRIFPRRLRSDRAENRYSGAGERASRADEDELEFQRRPRTLSHHNIFRAQGRYADDGAVRKSDTQPFVSVLYVGAPCRTSLMLKGENSSNFLE